MANASNFSIYTSFVEEVNPGETPATPSMRKLRTTDPLAIQGGKDTFQSEETQAHRQRVDLRHGRETVTGSIPVELSYGAFDAWIEALLGGVWSEEDAGTPEVLKVGNALKTFTVERGFPDISQYEVFRGVTPTQMDITISPTGITTATFNVIGMGWEAPTGTSLGTPSDVATNSPFDGVCNATLEEGGTEIAIVTGLSLSMANGRTTGALVGSCGSDIPANGQMQITGEMTARFQNAALVSKFKNESESSLMVQLKDLAGTEYLQFEFPRIKYTGDNKANNDNVVDVSMTFEALYDDNEASAVIVTRSNAE